MTRRGRGALAVVVLVLAALHFLLHVTFGLGAVAPDLLVVALLVLARRVGMGVAALVGFAFGLMEDALSLVAFGANALSLAAVGALGARTRDLFVGDSILFMAAYLAAGKWLRDSMHWVLMGSGRGDVLAAFVVQAPAGALYAAGAGLAVLAATGIWRD